MMFVEVNGKRFRFLYPQDVDAARAAMREAGITEAPLFDLFPNGNVVATGGTLKAEEPK